MIISWEITVIQSAYYTNKYLPAGTFIIRLKIIIDIEQFNTNLFYTNYSLICMKF